MDRIQNQWLEVLNSQFRYAYFQWNRKSLVELVTKVEKSVIPYHFDQRLPKNASLESWRTGNHLPLANIGNMPSNISLKQSFSVGFDCLHWRNHSAKENKWKSKNSSKLVFENINMTDTFTQMLRMLKEFALKILYPTPKRNTKSQFGDFEYICGKRNKSFNNFDIFVV